MQIMIEDVGLVPEAACDVLSIPMLNAAGVTFCSSSEYAELRTSKGELIARTTDQVEGVWCLTSFAELNWNDDPGYGIESYVCVINGFYPKCELYRDDPRAPYLYDLGDAPAGPNVFEIAGLAPAPEFSVEDDGKSESCHSKVDSSSCDNVLGDDDPPPLIDDSDEEPWFIDTAASQHTAPGNGDVPSGDEPPGDESSLIDTVNGHCDTDFIDAGYVVALRSTTAYLIA
jgi:hypothetical protein